jgi:hypothetical protein
MRLTHLHQRQQRWRVINRPLDNQRFYRAAIFAAITIKFPIIAIWMRRDFRKLDARAANRARILRVHAERSISKMHELSLHPQYAKTTV